MKKKQQQSLIIVGVLAIIVVIAGFWVYRNSTPGPFDDFAKCLKDQGAVMYGAFWCPHCQDQKALFGKSQKFIEYVECSTADSRGTTIACQKENITSYPTWAFSDGSRQTGTMSLSLLAEKTGCEL
jgi:thiol-disulfide isomerase/thioredoxin